MKGTCAYILSPYHIRVCKDGAVSSFYLLYSETYLRVLYSKCLDAQHQGL